MKGGSSWYIPLGGKKVFSQRPNWHDFLMVNKCQPDRPPKYEYDDKICNILILLIYCLAHFVSNPVKNIVITELGASANNFINTSVNISVDVHSQLLCRP
jgi:hypothetical protein